MPTKKELALGVIIVLSVVNFFLTCYDHSSAISRLLGPGDSSVTVGTDLFRYTKNSMEQRLQTKDELKQNGRQSKASLGKFRTECPNVLRYMLRGWWTQHKMTEEEREDLKRFYIDLRTFQGLPLNFQRDDNRCGDVPYLPPANKWRSLCDPYGPTPCCYQYTCTNKTTQQCTCTNCTDMRTLIHPEHATWYSEHAQCHPIAMSLSEMCVLLDGRSVNFVGDSLIRHLYIGFLMLLRGDFQFGALPPNSPEELKQQCHGKYMFPSHVGCTGKIETQAFLCDGRVNASFFSYYHPTKNHPTPQDMIQHILEKHSQPNSFTVFGFGSHYALNSSWTKEKSLLPLLNELSSLKMFNKFRLLWAGIHAPTIVKSPLYSKQSRVYVQRFNAEIMRALRQYGVPFFNTYNMTSYPVMAPDGSHYGLGLNRVKAVILVNYFLELRSIGVW